MDSTGRLYVSLLLISVLLGTQFPASKIAVDALDPLSVTAIRMTIAAIVGLAAIAIRGKWEIRAFRGPHTWALGGLLALVFVLLNLGIERTTASKTALLVNVSVVYVAMFMVVFFGERTTRSKTAGILTSLGGVIVLATRLDPNFLAGGEALGDLLVFLSGLTWSIFVVFTKSVVDRTGIDALNLAGALLTITAMFAILPLLFLPWSVPASPSVWAVLVYLGVLPTLLPLWLLIYSVARVSPTISALLILPAVFVAAVLSLVLLHDAIGVPTLIGGVLVLAGVYLATREPGRLGP